MRIYLLGSVLAVGLLAGACFADNQQPVARLAAAVNVNSRYIVETVELIGYDPDKVAPAVQEKLRELVGAGYNTETLDELARELRKDLHVRAVTRHLSRGSSPEMVQVVFEVTRRTVGVDISVPKFLYHSKQGWSGQVEASGTIARTHHLTFGVVSDGDELTERFAGYNARYENLHLGTDRIHFQFLFESYHEQWNRSTTDALSQPFAPSQDLYRTRRNLQPTLSFVVFKPLILTVGASFQRMESAMPVDQTASAHAILIGLRYHRPSETAGVFDADYTLRAAPRAFGSDYVYTRHKWAAGYSWTRGNHTVSDVLTAGLITGRAPLFERFVLGTSSMLRGWNRFEIDPLGGNRLVHNSVDYRYRFVNVFYDAGSLWNHGKLPSLRHSVGIGMHQSIFSLAVAFPVREGRVDPIFMVGMNY